MDNGNRLVVERVRNEAAMAIANHEKGCEERYGQIKVSIAELQAETKKNSDKLGAVGEKVDHLDSNVSKLSSDVTSTNKILKWCAGVVGSIVAISFGVFLKSLL